MDRIGGLTTGTHGQNDRGRAGDDITTGPDAFFVCLACFRVCVNIPPFIQFYS